MPGFKASVTGVGEINSLKVLEATGSMYLVSRLTIKGEAKAGAVVASGGATISKRSL